MSRREWAVGRLGGVGCWNSRGPLTEDGDFEQGWSLGLLAAGCVLDFRQGLEYSTSSRVFDF